MNIPDFFFQTEHGKLLLFEWVKNSSLFFKFTYSYHGHFQDEVAENYERKAHLSKWLFW